MALQFQLLQIPFSAGLDAKTDERAKLPPALDMAVDVEFDATRGLTTRKSYTAASLSVLGGGVIQTPRKFATYGSELLLFSDTGLYSYIPQSGKWALRGKHLAIATTETTRFATNGDQTQCDRAELSNVVLYAWCEASGAYVAAADKTNGAVILAPTLVSAAGATRTRLIVLTTVVQLYFVTSAGDLRVMSIDVANVATSVAAGIATPHPVITAASGFDLAYDVARIQSTDTVAIVARRNPNTSYTVLKVTAAYGITSSTKARASIAAVAIAVDPAGTDLVVVGLRAATVTADFINVGTFADHTTGLGFGTVGPGGLTQCVVAYRSTQIGGFYRAEVFWSGDSRAHGGVDAYVKHNWCDSGSHNGGEAVLVAAAEVASQAFEYSGEIYVWTSFLQSSTPGLGPLQSTYSLFDSTGFQCAKASAGNAGSPSGGAAVGCLPSVSISGTSYAFCGNYARRAIGSASDAFAQRAPRDIVIAFDSNEARRTVQYGQTLYIAAGEGLLQYDGVQITEVGYPIAPFSLAAIDGGAGSLPVGQYAYKQTFRWINAAGETDRSTSFGTSIGAIAASRQITFGFASLCTWNTHKTNIGIETWRTIVNPTADAPFYLITSPDPAVTTNPNKYETNSRTLVSLGTLLIDNMLDAVASTKEINPDNGGVLENIAPPPARLITADDERIYLGGVSGQPDTVWYSKIRTPGLVAGFNDALTFGVPADGGAMTAIAFLGQTLVVFRETAIYAFAGDGFDNLGQGNNYGPARIIALDCGAINAESVATLDTGLAFKSSKGWYLVDRGFNLTYIGAAVANFDSETVLATTVLQSQHQMRIITNGPRILMFDYLIPDQPRWAEWTCESATIPDATLWNGAHTYADADNQFLRVQSTAWPGVNYGMDIETAWIKLSDLQGFARVRKYQILGEYESSFKLRVRFAYNYRYIAAGVPDYVDDVLWDPYPAVAHSVMQVQLSPSIQQVESVKVRITAVAPDGVSAPTAGASMALTGIGLEVGIKAGLYKLLAAQQRK